MSDMEPAFGGDTFVEKRDGTALKHQLDVVRSIMLGGCWWTLDELAARYKERTGKIAQPAAISARLRDLRKSEYGSYNIEKRIRSGRLWEYHLGANTAPVPAFAHGKTSSESAGC